VCVPKYFAVTILIRWSSELRHLGQKSAPEEAELIKRAKVLYLLPSWNLK